MRSKTAGLGIVLAFSAPLAALSASARAEPPASVPDKDTQSLIDTYRRGQLDLFDTLRNDASPRRQVLAARLYVDDEDVPTVLRPKRQDVVANAAQLARGDAVVQWIAADSGNYYSSQCGPTRWPEAEVAALVRLEPDNAGALQYAVALAHAKGGQAALDEALSRMASATRADDHSGAEVAEWRKALTAHPEAGFGDSREDASVEERALLDALRHADSSVAPTTNALQSVCAPDGNVEQAWQRLGWCVEAGTLMAGKGTSFALRETGLKMLTAAGATPSDLAELQRQFDWLKAHAPNPLRNMTAFGDDLADLVADWRGAPNEIAATERRLERLGQPMTPPAGWVDADSEEKATASAAENAWRDYVRALLDDMRGSTDVRTQALALGSDKVFAFWLDTAGPADAPATKDASAPDALAALAAANPDDLLVQWVVATSSSDAAGAAIANVQRLDADNAAAWGLSLSAADADTPALLQRMAEAKRYDEHLADLLAPWLAAVGKRPIPLENLQATLLPSSSVENFSADTAGKAAALSFAMIHSTSASHFASVHTACKQRGDADDARRREACLAIGRLMLNSSDTAISARIGSTILREVGPLAPGDQQRERRIAWWQETQLNAFTEGSNLDAYFDDFASTGSEIEALRLAATRAGKAEPPAEWKSPSEKRAQKGK
ncbi:hypothetical protein [Dokdonella sp.]|uniref:hypothetical protein n=1 Tax=Dokdonella sp. TaxID=2291710 RepID=UPI001B2CFF4C|nr:hypothetical protein [Dokdonella sp.]MBO9662223.1 hypothetical protein [Dokdonella sp.]